MKAGGGISLDELLKRFGFFGIGVLSAGEAALPAVGGMGVGGGVEEAVEPCWHIKNLIYRFWKS